MSDLTELIKRVGEKDKMRGFQSILSLFCNERNKFNNTRTRKLDSIRHINLYFEILFLP